MFWKKVEARKETSEQAVLATEPLEFRYLDSVSLG